MSFATVVLLGVAAFWIIAYFFHTFLSSCQNYPYLWLLNKTGISVNLGYGRWYTTAFNRTFQKLGALNPRLIQRWFKLGAVIGLCLIIPSLLLLIVTLGKYFIGGVSAAEQALVPALPGVNLPLHEIFYYLLTLLGCSIIHEIGHAVAAIREDVRVLGCGILVFGVVPAAFVELPPEQLRLLSPWQQLRIFCAGVWHNLLLVVAAGLIIISLPLLLSALYSTGTGLTVINVEEGSAAGGRAGLSVGEVITGVGDCPVIDHLSWYKCLLHPMIPTGHCTDNSFIDSLNEAVKDFNKEMANVECCPATSENGLCFKQNDPEALHPFVCVPARRVLAQAPSYCNSSVDCPSSRYTCLTPAVDPTTKLIPVRRHYKEDMLFLGHPGDLYYAVSVSDYQPRWTILPLRFPSMIETSCRYIISFSGALALLNVVPCFGLDGQWITQAAIDLLLAGIFPRKQTRNLIFSCTLVFGTILLALNIIVGLMAIL